MDRSIAYAFGEEADNVTAKPEVVQDGSEVRGWTAGGVLRILGVLLLLGSAVAFSVQGYSYLADVVGSLPLFRFYSFLAFLAVLTSAGIFCIVRLKDATGARTLMGVATSFVPAQVLQLSAMILTCYTANVAVRYSIFQIPFQGVSATLLAAAVSIPVLLVIAYTGFSAMARPRAGVLTAVYAATNALLLIPTRDTEIIGGLVLAAFWLLLLVDRKLLQGELALTTVEGRVMRFVLTVPLFAMVARSLILYPSGAIFEAALAAIVATMGIAIIPRTAKEKDIQDLSEELSLIPLAFGWLRFMQGTVLSANFLEYHQLSYAATFIPVVVLPMACILAVISQVLRHNARLYQDIAIALAVGGALVQLRLSPGVLSSFSCVLISAVVILVAFVQERRGVFYLGSFSFLIGILSQIAQALEVVELSPWVTLGVLGLVAVVGASYLEKNGVELKRKLNSFKKELDSWK